jgi:type I restriction enzyme, S subunit
VARVCTAPAAVLPARVNQHVAIIRPRKTSFDADYLRWLLCAPEQQELLLGLSSAGATRNALTKGMLEALQVHMPPLQVQRELAVLLVEIEKRIDLLRQTNATLESIAQALFKSWFIDFDPVRAKAEGREPEGMDAATAALFPAEFEESALGLIPKGWRAGDLAMLCSNGGGFIQTGPFGSQLHASDYEAQGIPVVMPQDLEGRRISTERVARVSDEHVQRLSRHKLMVGDVVFSRRGDVGRHAAVTAEEAGWVCGTGCLLVRPGSAWPSPAYVSQALATTDATEWLKRHAVGATMPNLNTGILGGLPILLPDHRVLTAFEAVGGALEARISANRTQADQLAALRDTLLPRLISGKLRLPEAQAVLAGAAA